MGMLFQIYGDTSLTQILGWCMVFVGLILLNELGRRTKWGGILLFVIVPIILTIYFILIHVGLFGGAKNQEAMYMDGWFHYFKLYAADIGCVGFMMIKYGWGIGKKHWFKAWPFFIVAANILIAVVSDLESFIKGTMAGGFNGGWWASNEGVFLYGGWWNLLNALAGIVNILCMTGWWGIYSSKGQKDMLWPDMTFAFILAYDVWNFQYTYLNLPTHSWYCGVALLLAPTFAAAFWNKGGWIQNRANTLAIWCMFAQVVPLFQLSKTFSVMPTVYGRASEAGYSALDLYASKAGYSALDLYDSAISVYNNGGDAAKAVSGLGITANPTAQGVIAMASIVINVVVFTAIIKRAIEQHKNPYTNEIWTGTKDFELAMARKED